jgi:hypothetical protein
MDPAALNVRRLILTRKVSHRAQPTNGIVAGSDCLRKPQKRREGRIEFDAQASLDSLGHCRRGLALQVIFLNRFREIVHDADQIEIPKFAVIFSSGNMFNIELNSMPRPQ